MEPNLKVKAIECLLLPSLTPRTLPGYAMWTPQCHVVAQTPFGRPGHNPSAQDAQTPAQDTTHCPGHVRLVPGNIAPTQDAMPI